MRLCLTRSHQGVGTFYNAPLLGFVPLLLLIHLVILSVALRIETKHVWKRNVESGSKLASSLQATCPDEGNNNSQVLPLSSSMHIKIHVPSRVIPPGGSLAAVLQVRMLLLLEADPMLLLQMQLPLAQMLQESRVEGGQGTTAQTK